MRYILVILCIVTYYSALSLLEWGVSPDHGFLFTLEYIIVPLVLLPIGVVSIIAERSLTKNYAQLIARLSTKGFQVTHECKQGHQGFLIDNDSRQIIFLSADTEQEEYRCWELNFSDVLGTEVIRDKQVLIQTKKQGGLSRALVGGLIFGGVGAIVGGLSAGSKSTQTEVTRNLTLEVILNCPKHPMHRMSFDGEQSTIATVEFFQTLLELVMLDVDIPRANSAVDIRDTVRMVKLQVQNAA